MIIKIKLERDFKDQKENEMFLDLASKVSLKMQEFSDDTEVDVDEIVYPIVIDNYENEVIDYAKRILSFKSRNIDDVDELEIRYYMQIILEWIKYELQNELKKLAEASQSTQVRGYIS